MIKLSSIKMQGYKTFARETEMAFPASITAIVGPNGSGKSNVADAIRWVLGEQSFSLLRAKRTEDMIYSGSDNRARAGMAEVSIHFDNQDGWLNIDYSEVVLTRRAYRDGQNDYLINNQRVRLKDFGELLAKTGLSDRTYTIIGQGLVDTALSIRPDERRKLFEEAAGIGLYRSRKDEALRRLETTVRNLERASDICAEIKPRLRGLERQAARVSEYKLVKESLRANLLEWYGYHWFSTQQEVDGLRKAFDEANKSRDLSQQQMAEEKQSLGLIRSQIDETRSDIRALQDQMRALLDKEQAHNHNLAILEDRKQNALTAITQLETDLGGLEETVKAGQRSLELTNAEILHLKTELSTISQDYADAKKALASAKTTLQSLREKRNYLQKQLIDKEKLGIQFNSHHGELKERLLANQSELKQNEKMIAELSRTLVDLESEKKNLEKDLVNKQRLYDEAVHKHQTAVEDLTSIKTDLNETLNRTHQFELDKNRAQNQLDLLNQAQESFAGFSEGAKTLLQKSRSKAIDKEFVDIVTKLDVPERYEIAITAALGDAIDVLVLKDEPLNIENLNTVLASVQERVALIGQKDQCDTKVDVQISGDGVIALASELINNQSEYRPVIETLLGQYIVVETIEIAQQIRAKHADINIVTLNGEVFLANGMVLLGKNRSSSKVSHQRLSKTYQKDIDALNASITTNNKIEDKLNSKIADKEKEIEHFERELTISKQALSASQNALNELELKISKFDEQKQWFIQRKGESERVMERTKDAIAEMLQRAEENQMSVNELGKQIEDMRAQELKNDLDELEQKFVYLETENQMRNQSLKHHEKNLEDLKTRVHDDQQRLITMESRKSAQETLVGTLNQQAQLIREELELIKNQSELLRTDELVEKETLLSSLEEQFAMLSEEDLEKQKKFSIKERQITHLQLELVRQEEKLSTLRSRLEDDFGLIELDVRSDTRELTPLPFPDLVIESLPETMTLSDGLEDIIRQQKAQMRRIGSVNIEAEEEYQAVKTRYNDLNAQIEDLNLAIKDIHTMVRELDEVMKEAYLKTFHSVNAEFSAMFTRLFNGGSARLVLVDEDSPIEGGIEIEARLPGKREQGLVLLSGGERSLTAVALIFALLKVSPTPLCVLDEVDAMLDESNVGRFIDLLQELSKETQFILITHNRNTVAAADVIYGVTMGKDSASQLISLRLDEVDSSYMNA